MSLLLESIKVQDNNIYAWAYHEHRIMGSIKANFGTAANCHFTFDDLLRYVSHLDHRIYKLRVIYDDRNYSIEHHTYSLKPINSLQLVYDDQISYDHKYVDRTKLSSLYQKKNTADDILIIKDGKLTDSYYCNIALLKGSEWHTPHEPLLRGTKRRQLLAQRSIVESEIRAADIMEYTHIRLFNAMIEFGEVELQINAVISHQIV